MEFFYYHTHILFFMQASIAGPFPLNCEKYFRLNDENDCRPDIVNSFFPFNFRYIVYRIAICFSWFVGRELYILPMKCTFWLRVATFGEWGVFTFRIGTLISVLSSLSIFCWLTELVTLHPWYNDSISIISGFTIVASIICRVLNIKWDIPHGSGSKLNSFTY